MKKLTLIIGLAAIIFNGCSEQADPITPEQPEVQTMNVNINHTFDSEELTFLSKEYTLASGETVIFKRLAYLLADFYLVKSDDTRVYLDDQYALIAPASDPSNFKLIDIPLGEYKAFGFSIGLDSVLNHGDPNQYPTDHPLSPINNSLHWSWQGGYIFTALEGDVGGSTDNFIFHLAGSNNKINFELPIVFTKEKYALDAVLNYNLAEVFKTPEVFSLANDGESTHSTKSPTTLKLIRNMGDVFKVSKITNVNVVE